MAPEKIALFCAFALLSFFLVAAGALVVQMTAPQRSSETTGQQRAASPGPLSGAEAEAGAQQRLSGAERE